VGVGGREGKQGESDLREYLRELAQRGILARHASIPQLYGEYFSAVAEVEPRRFVKHLARRISSG